MCRDLFLCMRPANERRRYNVTSSLVRWAHTQNDPFVWYDTCLDEYCCFKQELTRWVHLWQSWHIAFSLVFVYTSSILMNIVKHLVAGSSNLCSIFNGLFLPDAVSASMIFTMAKSILQPTRWAIFGLFVFRLGLIDIFNDSKCQ